MEVMATSRQDPFEGRALAHEQSRRLRNAVVWVVVAGALVVALLLAVPDLRSVGRRITHMDTRWLALAVAFELISCLGYVAVFRLVFAGVPDALARRLAWAELAFGAALPVGGIGSLAFGAWVLRREGMGARQIAERSTVLFLLTSAVNVIVLIAVGLGLGIGLLPGPDRATLGFLPAAIGAVILFGILLLCRPAARLAPHVGSRFATVLRSLSGAIGETRRLALRPSRGLLGAYAYLLGDIATLWACTRGLGNGVPIAAVVLAYQLGLLATWLPIPGGVGVLDGGIIGMLLLYDAPASTAAAAVLVYHALMFWTRTVLGTIAFLSLRHGSADAPGASSG
jgi:uncharacterized membrane protein YbhN (UPF0104 family)